MRSLITSYQDNHRWDTIYLTQLGTVVYIAGAYVHSRIANGNGKTKTRKIKETHRTNKVYAAPIEAEGLDTFETFGTFETFETF